MITELKEGNLFMLSLRQLIFYTMLIGFISSFFPMTVLAQYKKRSGDKVVITKIKYDELKGGLNLELRNVSTKRKAPPKQKWGSIIVSYDTNQDWLNEMEVKCSALLIKKGKRRSNKKSRPLKFTLIEGGVTYLDIPEGKGHQSGIYVHPLTIERYGDVKAIHVELWLDGVKETEHNESLLKKSEAKKLRIKPNWWTAYRPLSNRLVNRYQTPFVFEGVDTGTAIKTTS